MASGEETDRSFHISAHEFVASRSGMGAGSERTSEETAEIRQLGT